MAVSPEARAIHAKASELFDRRGPRVSYTEYRRAVPRADPVQFSDTWSLYREGRLTPAAVQSQVLA
jgi:hypothetical protein